ncbi:hypothetical protein Ae263Ps1_0051c [Pseudonocardia sp. Ae263_Ps1]|nr:hypothetical protein Ae263Ps1_0051c [Pseudonocardia sp. Ae263_Ps1]OLL90966.1 hypothetical protein Ae356Ps1_0863 [Pseudonocardia sp. Ae356_Ps1]
MSRPPEGSRIAAILAHLSAPIAAVLSAGLLSLLGPLLVWLVKKDDPFARRAAAGAFNFNLSFLGALPAQLGADLHRGRDPRRSPAHARPVRGLRVVPHQGSDPGVEQRDLRLPVPAPGAVLTDRGCLSRD